MTNVALERIKRLEQALYKSTQYLEELNKEIGNRTIKFRVEENKKLLK